MPISHSGLLFWATCMVRIFRTIARKFKSREVAQAPIYVIVNSLLELSIYTQPFPTRCWCNAITLSCYLSPCQPLTARTDDLYTQLCIRPILIFKLPQDHIYRGLK